MRKCMSRLPELSSMFERDRVDLLPRQFLSRFAGSAAGLAKETVEARRRHEPEQNQFLIWTAETMPGVPRYENRSAFLAGVPHIVERDRAMAFQNVKGFLAVRVPVNRNA